MIGADQMRLEALPTVVLRPAKGAADQVAGNALSVVGPAHKRNAVVDERVRLIFFLSAPSVEPDLLRDLVREEVVIADDPVMFPSHKAAAAPSAQCFFVQRDQLLAATVCVEIA